MRKALALLMITASFSAAAEVYTWKDENGVTHFGSQPPPGQKNEQVEVQAPEPGRPSSKGQGDRNPSAQSRSSSGYSPYDSIKEGRESVQQARCRAAQNEFEDALRLYRLKRSISSYAVSDHSVKSAQRKVGLYCSDGVVASYEAAPSQPTRTCQWAINRIKTLNERWENSKMQGYKISEKQRYELKLEEYEREKANLCR